MGTSPYTLLLSPTPELNHHAHHLVNVISKGLGPSQALGQLEVLCRSTAGVGASLTTASHQPQIDLWERRLSNLMYRKQKNDAVPADTPQTVVQHGKSKGETESKHEAIQSCNNRISLLESQVKKMNSPYRKVPEKALCSAPTVISNFVLSSKAVSE